MTQVQKNKSNVGEGIVKPGARPIRVIVDDSGEYWLCDAHIDPNTTDFRNAGCMAYSEVQMAEGG
jgi:hypothetical protein